MAAGAGAAGRPPGGTRSGLYELPTAPQARARPATGTLGLWSGGARGELRLPGLSKAENTLK